MPTVEKVFNASLERHEVQVYSQPFIFEPRSFTDVPEKFIEPIINEHSGRGLFVYRNDDDLKVKERAALLNYLQRLEVRIRAYQMELDEYKKRGATLDQKLEHKRALRWREEIMTKLEMEAPIQKEVSFLDAKDMQADIFKGIETKVEAPKPQVSKKTSFKETDISKEINS